MEGPVLFLITFFMMHGCGGMLLTSPPSRTTVRLLFASKEDSVVWLVDKCN